MSALQGITVLDLSRVLAGPWCTQLLADLGAEVIKIERPGSGDDTRAWGPPYLKDADGNPTSESAYYLSCNRGKRSVAVDFTQPEGRRLVRELARQADVLVENFKVGGLAKYGLDYASLRELNPRLIYCSITGFGQDGPYAERAGYDFIIQGMGGLMSLTGEPDHVTGGGPVKVGVAVADIFTGLYAANAIQAALLARHRTGEGQHIDVALLDSQVAILANQAMNYLTSGKPPGRLGNAHPNIVPYQVFACSDGHLILAVGNDSQFAKFCQLAGHPELAADPRFATNAARVEHRATLVPIIAELMLARTQADWLAALEEVGVPCGPINRLDQVFADPQVQARGLHQQLPHPLAGEAPTVVAPFRLSGTPLVYEQAPPLLGADTRAALQERLGLDAAQIEALIAAGVVGAR